MHAYIHTYIHTAILLISLHTYIHNFLTLRRFVNRIAAQTGFNTIFATRFGFPVRTRVQKKTSFRATGLYVTGCVSLTPTFVFLRKGAELFGALAAESIQNGPFSGAAAEKDVRSDARDAPVPEFPSAHMCYKRRFGPPVYTSLLGGPPRLDSATLVKGNHVFDALAAESFQNGPFSGAAAEKDIASEARNAPVPGGPGASKTITFPLLLENEIHPGSASRKISKSWVGPKVRKRPPT